MRQAKVRIGRWAHGLPMSLEEFDKAEGQPGYIYELSRGMVTVYDIPGPKHLRMVHEARRQLLRYDQAHPGIIVGIASIGECKVLVAKLQSERHPDLAVYMSRPPGKGNIWRKWVPEIVIEVVSPQSDFRDYKEKPKEYLQFGAKEYWILDADERKMVVLKRVGGQRRRKTVKPPQVHKPGFLPGLEFSCKKVFDAAEATRQMGKSRTRR
jgi:Uma2 family endonuclease